MAKNTDVTTQLAAQEGTVSTTEAPAVAEENNTQNAESDQADFAAKFQELVTKYSDLESKSKERIEALKKERKTLEGKLLQSENAYKGLQRESTSKMQEAAELRKQAATNQALTTQINELNAMIETIGKRVLDDGEIENLQERRRIAKIEAENKALKEVPQPSTVQPNNNSMTLEGERKAFLNYYFPNAKVDPNDPSIDWSEDIARTNPNEALRRIVNSVNKIVVKKERKQAEKTVESLVAQRTQELTSNFQVELEKMKTEAVKVAEENAQRLAREETEKRLRAMGIDANGTPQSEGTRTLRNALNEELDEGLLTKGAPGSRERREAVDEYNRRMQELRGRLSR